MNSGKEFTFIGIGNRFRSDDAAGILAMEALRAKGLPANYIEATGEGAALIDLMIGFKKIYLLDAVCSGAKPGTVFRFDAKQEVLPSRFFNYSTHAFSVAEAVEMARALDQLPDSLIVYGIEGSNFDAGASLSSDVKDGIRQVVRQITNELKLNA